MCQNDLSSSKRKTVSDGSCFSPKEEYGEKRRTNDCVLRRRGMERGIAQEKVLGIKNMIELCQEWGGTYDNTQFQVEKRYHLNEAEARAYMEQYWK